MNPQTSTRFSLKQRKMLFQYVRISYSTVSCVTYKSASKTEQISPSFEWSTYSSSSASLIHSWRKNQAFGWHAQMPYLRIRVWGMASGKGAKVLSIIGSFLVESHIKGFIVSVADVLKGKAVVLTTLARKEDMLKRPIFRHQSSSNG